MNFTIYKPAEFRINIMTGLTDKFHFNPLLSENIERSVFNYAIQECLNKKIVPSWNKKEFCVLYIDRLRMFYVNFNKYPMFLKKIKEGEISPSRLEKITHMEIDEEKWNILIEKILEQERQKDNNEGHNITNIFQCPKCKACDASYYVMQTRSADEPMTTFITCRVCNKRWKE